MILVNGRSLEPYAIGFARASGAFIREGPCLT